MGEFQKIEITTEMEAELNRWEPFNRPETVVCAVFEAMLLKDALPGVGVERV